MRSIEWWHFQWPWGTPNPVFKVKAFSSQLSQKRCILGTKFLYNRTLIGNHTQSIEWYHFQCPWVTSDPDFNVMTFLKSEKRRVIKTKLLLHNRKLEWYYVWWPWLKSKRVAHFFLSASAEVLVFTHAAVTSGSFWVRLQEATNSSQSEFTTHLKRNQHCLFTNSDAKEAKQYFP